MDFSWRKLEQRVRAIATLKWKSSATPQHLGGIDFDAVINPSEDEMILIEISKRDDLQKIRDDCTKINALRLQKLSEGTLCRGFIVLEGEPTNSMVETGTQNKVQVLSVAGFFNSFFDYNSYLTMREMQPFGSALNPFTGEKDDIEYVNVCYESERDDSDFDADWIVTRLFEGDRLVLLGDYGTGKSRCVAKVFDLISTTRRQIGRQVFAINLREHWGASSASEIIAGHLEGLGLSGQIDSAMQIINSGGCLLLLDGVDEVGAQLFGTKRENRRSIRRTALAGIRKLVEQNKSGVLITSRSQYFDSDEEMLDCLGLSLNKNTKILRCPDEFSEFESRTYLHQIGISARIPDWLPKKPLVFQVLSTLDKSDATDLLEEALGEFAFWGKFISAVSDREARIHGSLDSGTVREVLMTLADRTREANEYLGRMSVKDVREAYERVTGDSPDEAGEQMLMRLCTLGRVSPESPERQFVDTYIVDGLRADALLSHIDRHDRTIAKQIWKQPLRRLGWHLLWHSLERFKKERIYKAMLGALATGINCQAYIEIFSSLMAQHEDDVLSADNFVVHDAEIYWLTVGERRVSDLIISNCYIETLELKSEKEEYKSDIRVNDSEIYYIQGISSEDGIPNWIANTSVEHFDTMSTITRIRLSDLGAPHIVLLSIIHRIFFQPGRGRQENALYKSGFGHKFDPKLIKKVIALLLGENVIKKIPGDDGPIYIPVRSQTRRMAKIKNELGLSNDPLWYAAAKMS